MVHKKRGITMIRNLVYFRFRSVGGWRTHSSMKDLLSRLKNNKPAGEAASKGGIPAVVSSSRIPASSPVNNTAAPAKTESMPAASIREVVKSDNKATVASVSGSSSRLTDILRESSKPSSFGTGITGLSQSINAFTKGKAISGGGNNSKFSDSILQKTLATPSSTFTSSLFKNTSDSLQTTSFKSKFTVDSKPLSSSAPKSTFGEIFRNNADSINSAARGNLPTSVRDAQRNAADRVSNHLFINSFTHSLIYLFYFS